MSSKITNPHASKDKCQWCGSHTNSIEKMTSCKDQICDKCAIKNSKCKSKCPLCWEKQISRYLIFNRTCSGNSFILN